MTEAVSVVRSIYDFNHEPFSFVIIESENCPFCKMVKELLPRMSGSLPIFSIDVGEAKKMYDGIKGTPVVMAVDQALKPISRLDGMSNRRMYMLAFSQIMRANATSKFMRVVWYFIAFLVSLYLAFKSGNRAFVTPRALRKERAKICKTECGAKWFCPECKCSLPLKIGVSVSSCPDGRW